MTQHPANDWQWVDDAEEGFVTWFNQDCGPYTWQCEWFFGDCDLMYKWMHSAYVSGYERGLYGRLEEKQ
jgi:hypothetical protein